MRLIHSLTQYSYSPEELRKCVRPSDIWDYALDQDSIIEQVTEISNSFYESSFQVKHLRTHTLRGKTLYSSNSLYDSLCLRRTDELLKVALCTTLIHRDHEIRQLLETLRGEGETQIFRTDIASFFESVNFAGVLRKLEVDGFRNSAALKHLWSLNQYLLDTFRFSGLPRGIGISSTLADYVMRDVDQKIQALEGVSYYSRYVDDICIVHAIDGKELCEQLEQSLPDLDLNENKTRHFSTSVGGSLEYLGYSIDVKDPKVVRVAQKKLNRVKQRLVYALRDYTINSNFGLLRDRLDFLMCSTEMLMLRRKQPVMAGLKHTYRHCSNREFTEQLQELDRFYYRLLKSVRYALSNRVRAKLAPHQRSELLGLSFASASRSSITRRVRQDRIADIKRVWQYA